MVEEYPPYPTGARDSLLVTLGVAVIAIIIVLVKCRDTRKKENISVKTQIWDWLKMTLLLEDRY